MNTQPRHPKCRALPVELHPDIYFSAIIPRRGRKSKIFCLWSFLWSKLLLCRFRQPGKIPQTKVLQGFVAFRPALSRIPPRHSQSRRATNCAIVGLSGRPHSIPYSTPVFKSFLHRRPQKETPPGAAGKGRQRAGI